MSLVKRILHYLKGFVGREIVMTNNGGFYMFVGGNLISWHSKKQHVVTHSSAKIEYHAIAPATCELIWLKGVLSELAFSSSISMSLFCNDVDRR